LSLENSVERQPQYFDTQARGSIERPQIRKDKSLGIV
jgi:hypothetical protein